MGILPLILYELAIIGFVISGFPTWDLEEAHRLAWQYDIPYLLILFSIAYSCMGVWYHFIRKEKPRKKDWTRWFNNN